MPESGESLDDGGLEEPERQFEGGTETEFDRLAGILADGLVGAAGGLVGTAAMSVVLLVAETAGVFDRASFATLTSLVGLGGVGPDVAVGFLLFLAGGMVPWPLLFASLQNYLPGERPPVAGVVFGTALWTGFALAFRDGFAGLALVGYLGATLVAHWVYGASLGLVFEYLSERPDTLV